MFIRTSHRYGNVGWPSPQVFRSGVAMSLDLIDETCDEHPWTFVLHLPSALLSLFIALCFPSHFVCLCRLICSLMISGQADIDVDLHITQRSFDTIIRHTSRSGRPSTCSCAQPMSTNKPRLIDTPHRELYPWLQALVLLSGGQAKPRIWRRQRWSSLRVRMRPCKGPE